MTKSRSDGRSHDAPRPITITHGFQRVPEGSVLYRCGKTTVLRAASIEESVPPWMKGKGRGWVSAEYIPEGSTEEGLGWLNAAQHTDV